MDFILGLLKSIIGMGASKVAGGQAGTEVMAQPRDQLMVTQANYQYHRNTYRSLLWLSMIEAAIIAVLILIAAFIIISANPQDRFFVASVDGRITRIIPLDTPLVDNNEMYVKVGTAVAASMTFGFLDYDQRVVELSPFFEAQALSGLHKALLGAGGTAAMIQKGQIYVTNVEPTRPGGVISQGVVDHVYQWVILVPVTVTLQTGADTSTQTIARWNIQVLVQRAKALEVKNGFIITNVLAASPEGQPVPVQQPTGSAP